MIHGLSHDGNLNKVTASIVLSHVFLICTSKFEFTFTARIQNATVPEDTTHKRNTHWWGTTKVTAVTSTFVKLFVNKSTCWKCRLSELNMTGLTCAFVYILSRQRQLQLPLSFPTSDIVIYYTADSSV